MRARAEDGSATVLVTVLAVALSMCAVAGLVAGAVLVASRRAAAAADLAALAGAEAARATTLGAGFADPCASAGAVAAANSAHLVDCAALDGQVTVAVTIEVAPLRLLQVDVPGRARAGPVSSAPAEQAAGD